MSFKLASLPRREGENATIGGLAPNALKNEKGDRLFIPSLEIVETSAIGLGATPPRSNLCTSGTINLLVRSEAL